MRKGSKNPRLSKMLKAVFVLFGTNALVNNLKLKRGLWKEFQVKEILYQNIFKDMIVMFIHLT